MHKGLTFSHIGLFVNDMRRMTDFYHGMLDFTITDQGTLELETGTRALTFLSRDPDEHHQIVLVEGRPSAIDFNVVNQISMKADSVSTLRERHRRFVSARLPGIAVVTHGNALSMYAPDPEGNRLELYIDLPWYVSQPMRVPVDFSLDDDALMESLEQHARSLLGFEPRARWRERMVRRMGITDMRADL